MGNSRIIYIAASICFYALWASAPLNARGNQDGSPAWVLHKQKVQAEKLDMKPAERPCVNWGWAAVVSDMAAARGIHISQQYLIDRLYGGSRCIDAVADSEALAKAISRDYVLQDGQKFALEARFTPGAPVQTDPLIASVRQNRPIMLLWCNHPYLLTGITYDEYIAETGNKMFVVTELQLFDPLAQEGKRAVVFARNQDNPGDINGVLDLSVYTK
jgi:hypothetical protein